ncbi:MAG: leucine-rich repeat domain-containing protein [Candidatus Aminicenantes bacterium]|nr:leucine-rich repeat domain-containing protein [Candidatus Aminicenantes bacterium]NIM77846.1 leucine-rich repeat domain-containing protein [Candidatus Aminicenantes bacterium]NIO79762.1 leucine-rich repeat domain-containing protein [Candidatus Aminicenantes bacterium]NIQ65715.1 leucine-rich repeat domain-containing protein [Candidatus Aminicenantes bacterium]NIT21716.1 leucine-rich repeat domain-containing protein [Candidatus Aminicenantes bacterium]
MEDILNKVFRFRKVIITCRTQFFPSEEEEPGETGVLKFGGQKGYHVFRKMYISPFDEKDIKKYLNKKFSVFNFRKKQKALQIVKHSPNLMVRPMLLSYIDDLLKSNREYEFTYQVYEELIGRWIERESRRFKEDKRENFKEELYKFSKAIALDIYRNRESRKGLIIDREEIKPFAEEHSIQLDEIEMKSRSLLNRNAQGEYKFSHKSILEYFLTLEILSNYVFAKEFSFEGMDQAKSFYTNMWKECTFKFLTKINLKGDYRIKGSTKERELSKLKLNELENIIILNLSLNGLIDISPLKELTGLHSLDLRNNWLTDISPLKELKGLERLYLDNNHLTDIRPLKELKGLERLDLKGNHLTDISPLKELTGLKGLVLNGNHLTDISPLKELKKLECLFIQDNPIPKEQIEELEKALPSCKIYR